MLWRVYQFSQLELRSFVQPKHAVPKSVLLPADELCNGILNGRARWHHIMKDGQLPSRLRIHCLVLDRTNPRLWDMNLDNWILRRRLIACQWVDAYQNGTPTHDDQRYHRRRVMLLRPTRTRRGMNGPPSTNFLVVLQVPRR